MAVSSYCLAGLTSSLVWGISTAWFLFCFCNFSMVYFKGDVSGHKGGSFGSSRVGVSPGRGLLFLDDLMGVEGARAQHLQRLFSATGQTQEGMTPTGCPRPGFSFPKGTLSSCA